jgi:hypothetical protein
MERLFIHPYCIYRKLSESLRDGLFESVDDASLHIFVESKLLDAHP